MEKADGFTILFLTRRMEDSVFICDDGRNDYMLRAVQEPVNLEKLAILRYKFDVALEHAQRSDRECGAAVQRLQVVTKKLKRWRKSWRLRKRHRKSSIR